MTLKSGSEVTTYGFLLLSNSKLVRKFLRYSQCCCQNLFIGLETETLDKMNSSALESRDHGVEIITLDIRLQKCRVKGP